MTACKIRGVTEESINDLKGLYNCRGIKALLIIQWCVGDDGPICRYYQV